MAPSRTKRCILADCWPISASSVGANRWVRDDEREKERVGSAHIRFLIAVPGKLLGWRCCDQETGYTLLDLSYRLLRLEKGPLSLRYNNYWNVLKWENIWHILCWSFVMNNTEQNNVYTTVCPILVENIACCLVQLCHRAIVLFVTLDCIQSFPKCCFLIKFIVAPWFYKFISKVCHLIKFIVALRLYTFICKVSSVKIIVVLVLHTIISILFFIKCWSNYCRP